MSARRWLLRAPGGLYPPMLGLPPTAVGPTPAESEATGQPLILTTPQVGSTPQSNDVVVVSVQVKPASEVEGAP